MVRFVLLRIWHALADLCCWLATADPSSSGVRHGRRAAWELTASVWVALTFATRWRTFRRRRQQRRDHPPRATTEFAGARFEPVAAPSGSRAGRRSVLQPAPGPSVRSAAFAAGTYRSPERHR